jgi:hypothetical protein
MLPGKKIEEIRKLESYDENISNILKKINYNKLIEGRIGKNKIKGYSLLELKKIMRDLGVVSSGKKKNEIIDYIKKLFDEIQIS